MSECSVKGRLVLTGPSNEQAMSRIRSVIAGGGSSNMRNLGVPQPLVVKEARGCMIVDIEDNELIDVNMGYGPHIFGYADDDVLGSLAGQLKSLHMTGLPSVLDARAAELIHEFVPSMEQVRFANSGTEAIASALRLARVITGRSLVVTFEGHYHGWSETILRKVAPGIGPQKVLPGALGMVPEALQNTLQVAWNDVEALEDIFMSFGGSIAAVILEPVLANDGVSSPADGFLESVREVTRRHGSLLIFDEVITGFRVAAGGAQERYGVVPDLTIFSKAMAGGFPVSAFGGSKEVMDPLARNEALHAGVFAGNHLAMCAVTATLEKIRASPSTYDRLEQLGQHVEDRLREGTVNSDVPVEIERVGSVIGFSLLTEEGVKTETGARLRPRFDMEAHRRLQMRCQERGVYFHPNPREPWFLCTAHSIPILDIIVDTILEALSE